MNGSRKTALCLAAIAFIAVIQGLAPAARADVLLYEGFDMGATAGSLTGKAGATSTGFAPASTWTDHSNGDNPTPTIASVTYQTAGLTFSSLPVVGGSAALNMPNAGGGFTRTDASRPLGFTATGTIYGSYLVNLAATTQNNQDITSIIVGSSSDYGGSGQADAFDSSFQMELNADGFQTESSTGGFGAGRIHGALGANSFDDSGTVLSEGTTYLVIFKMTGLGATAQTQTLTEWVLTAAQFNNFAPSGLDESELDAATLGSASTDVQERGTTSTTDNAQLLSTYYMHLFGALGSNATIDELRISNANIGEAVEAPEPASLGLLAVGGLMLLKRRRGTR